MSEESNKIKQYLQAMQELLQKESTDITEEEKQSITRIVNYAESTQMIEPIIQEDENGLKPNFILDHGIKDIFEKIDDKYIIEAINQLNDSKFKKECKIKLGATEYFDTTGDNAKYMLRGDLKAEIENGLQDEITNISLIEFQTDYNKNMPKRVYDYGNNNLLPIKREIKRMINGKMVMLVEEVNVRPFEMVIYTSSKFKQKEGVFRFNVTAPHYESNGIEQYGKKGDVITYLIPFVNIFQMSLKELKESKFFFLQCIYLYKYKQDKDLLNDAKISEIATEIENNLKEKLTPEEFEIAMRHLTNIYEDIYRVVEAEPIKYGKVLKHMNAVRTTFYDELLGETGIELRKARKEIKKIRQEKAQEKEQAEEKIRQVKAQAEEKNRQEKEQAEEKIRLAEEKNRQEKEQAEEKIRLAEEKVQQEKEQAEEKIRLAEEKVQQEKKLAEEKNRQAEEKNRQEKEQMIQIMIKKGYKDEEIEEISGKTKEEIARIRKEIQN